MLLYIHIPFCASKCGYCAFTSFVNEETYFESYIEALCVDLAQILKGKDYVLSSIFIGGGTPNLLDSIHYEKIFTQIRAYARLEETCEISIESNVNLLNPQWCRDLRALGANRLSIGVQSFYAPKLAYLERDHSAKDIFHRVESAYNAGFTNINCDMMITPLDSYNILESDLTQVLNLPISHLSLYALSIDEGSRFAGQTNVVRGNVDEALSFYARDWLQAQGFMQYEVSNYTRNTQTQCAHNMGYWQGREYLGCGASAVGRVGRVRMRAYPNLKEYIKSPTARFNEHLSVEDIQIENLMLGLRMSRGAWLKLAPLEQENQAWQECIEAGESIGCGLEVSDFKKPPLRFLLDEGKCHLLECEGAKQGRILAKQSREREKCKGEMCEKISYLVANELFLADEIALWILRHK
ncbi:radical SAM family heme chaperone HemW [Helicobacter typhlonius]|uniref:radical SAM family heme chaperone HemW n=1 Tax=Helicobacter typhlonius TaxID=76936 RepID=UPI002FE40DD1